MDHSLYYTSDTHPPLLLFLSAFVFYILIVNHCGKYILNILYIYSTWMYYQSVTVKEEKYLLTGEMKHWTPIISNFQRLYLLSSVFIYSFWYWETLWWGNKCAIEVHACKICTDGSMNTCACIRKINAFYMMIFSVKLKGNVNIYMLISVVNLKKEKIGSCAVIHV